MPLRFAHADDSHLDEDRYCILSATTKQRDMQQRSRVNFSLVGRRNIPQMLPQVLP
jgi:hypothetical protein